MSDVKSVKYPLQSAEVQVAHDNGTDSDAVNVTDGVQNITTKITSRSYPSITAVKGVPAKWTIQAGQEDLNGCNNAISIPAYGIELELKPGDNIVKFTPEKSGTVPYSCWMGMIRSKINVVDH